MTYSHEHEYASGRCRYCGGDDPEQTNEETDNRIAELVNLKQKLKE